MRFCVLLLILVFFVQTAQAQKPPVKYGDIPMDDLKMTVYPTDSSAAAAVLVDYGTAYLNVMSSSINMVFERHTRIKILRKDGLRWGDVAILLRQAGSTEERVSSIKASTYNLVDGKMVESKLDKKGMFKEKFNRSFNQQKFTMPDVKEGSILEYSYTVTSEFWTNFPNWQFQRTIPTRWSEYWAMIPDFFHYERYMQGYLSVSTNESKDLNVNGVQVKGHHWIVKDAPAFREEPYMTSEDNYISRINFALSYVAFPGQPTREIMGSWSKLNDDLLKDEDFGRVIDRSGFLKEITAQVTAGLTEPIQKVEAIHRYVSQNIEWDGTEDFYPGDLKKILEKKKGTSGDINVLMASMIDKANIPVDMVLLSTRSHGFIRPAYPMTRQFNYVVCAVRLADKVILLDATEKYLPYTILPDRCLNGQGLVISKTNHGWLNIEPKAKGRNVINVDARLTADGSIEGKVNFSNEGYHALPVRKRYHARDQEAFVKEFQSEKQWTLANSEFNNVSENDKHFVHAHEVTIAEHGEVMGDAIYLNPLITSRIKQNPFKSETRVYPIDYGAPSEEVFMCKIQIPDGYKVDELPKSKVMTLPQNGGRYVYNISHSGSNITLTSIFTMNQVIVPQTDHAVLREFYNQVVAKQAEQIVLKKN
ncbi:MAG: DUF3857 domain-containing protein [Cytophagales bacterium]|nr:DUF3857 domain-containing protein [Cytophagales bacterium]